MRIVTAVAIIALLALTACNSPAIPPGNYGTVSGTVTSTSGQPVAGVTVQADYGPSYVTGADGKYSIPTVPISSANSPAHIQVTVVPPGYAVPAARDDVQVIAGQITANINFVLTPI
jgi:protocatechuate 3,4-dioxygenase beta subunit